MANALRVPVRSCQFRKKPRWAPRRWDSTYELIVSYSCLGKSNSEIAKIFGYTPQHVSNILNTPEAIIVKRQLLEHLKEKVVQHIPERLALIADKATERLYDLIHDDDKFAASPFAVVDRGLKVLTGLNHLKGESDAKGGVNINKAIILAPELAARMTQALENSRKAKELNPWPKEEPDASSSE